MFWYKSWLETRFRLLFAIFFAAFPMAFFAARHALSTQAAPSLAALEGASGFMAFYWSIVALYLAGSGVKTQATSRPSRGLHGSMLFTLSLPVSRFRLLATRAALGLLETAAILVIPACSMWIISPGFRPDVSASDVMKFWLTLFVCGTGFYGLGVLFSTFLDDISQHWASLLGIASASWLLSLPRVPASANIFRAMGAGSPLFTHDLPWMSMGISLTLGILLFIGAAGIIRARDF